jgi:hypothetical protein
MCKLGGGGNVLMPTALAGQLIASKGTKLPIPQVRAARSGSPSLDERPPKTMA